MANLNNRHEEQLIMENYEWKWFWAGRMPQVSLATGADISNLAKLDRKFWLAISMPVKGVRFDSRMLKFMDSDGDGRIRTAEVIESIEFLKAKGVNLDDLFNPPEEDAAKLDDILARESDLAKVEPSSEDKALLAAWEAKGDSVKIDGIGTLDGMAAASSALSDVEPVIDAYFTPPEDMPLVTDDVDKVLPLKERLNPKFLEAVLAFAEKCVVPVLGEKEVLDRLEWKKVKAAFAPYRAWVVSKPVMSSRAMAELEEQEKVLRYKLHLLEFLENYVNMRRLYSVDDLAIFQTGTLRIDAKEMNLCFHVDSEAAHSALAEKSKCCVIYLKLSRPSEKKETNVCAVVTAGTIRGLYAGRNGVFYDRDGKDWEAVVTKVVEAEVSLFEAFCSPWRKLGEGIAASVKKFFGDKQTAAQAKLEAGAQSAQAGGAAMASSVAAIGIGIGMVGAAFASIMAAVSSMTWWEMIVSILALVLVVSLPSVVLAWFKLCQRDIGAILNASGWAINRPMRFSIKRARAFTKVARNPFMSRFALVAAAVLLVAAVVLCRMLSGCGECGAAQEAPACEAATETPAESAT